MSAVIALRALLMQASAVTSLVGSRCEPAPLPQGTALPALALQQISGRTLPHLDASSGYQIQIERVSVVCLAADYPTQKALVAAVAGACNFKYGPIAGVKVIVVEPATQGPDLRDDDRSVFHQAVDFVVTFQSP